MEVRVESMRRLRFDDGSPVRAASAVAPFGGGWLVAQDDATHAAWVRPGSVTRLRVLPPVDGHDAFSAARGTKHLKPDLEAACDDGAGRVLLLGSGSSPRRTRGVLVGADGARAVDLAAVHAAVVQRLGIAEDQLNMEGACRLGTRLRWFARGNLRAGVPSSSVDVPVEQLLAAFDAGDAAAVQVTGARSYDLGSVDGVGLTVTDAVALTDGRVLVSAAAEDTPNAVDDGPVVAAAVAVLDGDRVVSVLPLPEVGDRVLKVEGLALLETAPTHLRLLAVVDEDDADAASAELVLRVDLA